MDNLIALLIFLFPLAFSPGPGNMFFAANGARYGVRATLNANAGYHVATLGVTIACGLGFASVMTRSPLVFEIIRWLGSGYVLLLAYRFLRAGTQDSSSTAKPISFADGVALMVLNPKAYVIIMLMFSQFLTDMDGLRAVLAISAVFTLNNGVSFLIWTILGDQIGGYFRHERHAALLNLIFASALALVALWMLAR